MSRCELHPIRTTLILALLTGGLVVIALTVTVVVAAPGLSLRQSVTAGGDFSGAAGAYHLRGTVGQAIAGQVDAGNPALCAGYWCRASYSIYLPVAIRW